MFTAQATARDMAAAGRGDEIEEIARAISKVAPELPSERDQNELRMAPCIPIPECPGVTERIPP